MPAKNDDTQLNAIAMTKNEIWQSVDAELKRAKRKHRYFPKHICAQVSVITEEVGELVREANELKYNKKANKQEVEQNMKTEAIQVIVTTLRFLENMK